MLTHRIRHHFVLSVILCSLLTSVHASSAGAGVTGFQMLLDKTGSSQYMNIDVGERYAVAQKYVGSSWDIVVWDLTQDPPVEVPFAADPLKHESLPSIHGNVIGYRDGDDAMTWKDVDGNYVAGFYGSIAASNDRPVTGQDYWAHAYDLEGNGRYQLSVHEFGAMPSEVFSTAAHVDSRDPDLWRDVLVWTQDSSAEYRLLSETSLDPVLTAGTITTGIEHHNPSVWGEWVVFEDRYLNADYNIVAYNMLTHEQFEYGHDGAYDRSPSVFNDHLLYTSTATDGSYSRVYMVDLVSRTEQLMWQTSNRQVFEDLPTSLSGSFAAWSTAQGFVDVDAHAARLLSDVTVERLAGDDRYRTSVAISEAAFPEATKPSGPPNNWARTVFISTGANFPDALAASGLAGARRAPILMTPTDRLHPAIKDELQRLSPLYVRVLGGTAAVSDETFAQIQAALPTAEVTRIAGSNRYATARAIADGWSGFWRSSAAFVATGANFPDALAASPIAASQFMPIFLAEPDGISPATIDSMKNFGITDVYMLGGPAAVSQLSEDRLQDAFGMMHVRRLWGTDRYATASEIARFGIDENPWTEWSGVTIATGQNFPDALTGGVLAGRRGTVMLMTKNGDLPDASKGVLSSYAKGTPRVTIFGGTSAVSTVVEQQVLNAVEQ